MSTELHTWRGIPITELSREQLLEALRGAYREIADMRVSSQRSYEVHREAAEARYATERAHHIASRQAERERDETLQRNATMIIANG